MFNLQYEQEYEQALQELEKAKKGPLPFLEEYGAHLTDEDIVAIEIWYKARRRWIEVSQKYFGGGWNSIGEWAGR